MRRVLPLALTAVLVAGCSTSEQQAAAPEVRLERPTPTPTPTPTPSGPATLGARQETRDDTSAVTVTATRLRPLTLTDSTLGRAGYSYLGVDAKVCVVTHTGTEPITVSPGPWSLSFADDTTVDATFISSGMFNVPMYPQDRIVRPGRCVRGWIPFEVPKDARPAVLLYQPGSGNALEWRVK
ncbi:DUF4352 domain-containing protein [Streptosporangium sandarakinum]